MPRRYGVRMSKRIGVFFMLLLGTLGLLACGATDTQMERIASKFTQPAIEVTALDLFKEYSRDSEAAKLKYEGRRVLVSGTVEDVYDDENFEPTVAFDVCRTDYCFEGIVAQFAERHRDVVYSWTSRDDVQVLCYIPIDDFAWPSAASLRMCQPIN